MASRNELSEIFLNSDTIGDEFFIEIVETKLNLTREKFKLRLVLLSPATGKNENFVSVLYRAKIKIEILATNSRQSVDVIIKALLTTMKELKEFGVFPRERFVYENVLNSFEKIWLEKAGEVIQFGPRSIKFETDPYEIIVLDDLKAGKYEMLDRKVGLNLDQTQLLLTKLAKFHAASAIRYQNDGIIQPYFDRKASMPPMSDDSPFKKGFLRMFHKFVDAIKSYGDCDIYHEKFAKYDTDKLTIQWIEVAEPMRCGFQILNHGDIWLNNMMFKSDEEGNLLDVSMIDFQTPFWAGPGVDLFYFLISSVSDDIKIEQFDNLIKFYHDNLTTALKKLEFDQHIPTLNEVYDDLTDKSSFGSTLLMFIMAIVKYDSTEELNLEDLMMGDDNSEDFDRIYKNENFKKAVKLWLPFLNNRGYLDNLMKK